MKELSEVLGYDVSFSDEEVLKNASEAYSEYVEKELSAEVLLLMKSLYS